MADDGGLSRRRLLATSGALALTGAFGTAIVGPRAAFADPAPSPAGGPRIMTSTLTGTFQPGAPDWFYLPVDVPRGVSRIDVVYSYDRPAVPPGAVGNALDIGCFDPSGLQLGNGRGFRGWSGGFRDRFTISATDATPGYLPGPVDPGTWHVVLGPYTVAPQGLTWTVEVTLTLGEPGPPARPNPAPQRLPGRGAGWYRGDCHLHTVYSDGRRTPAEVAARAREAGLDFIVSTDHNTTSSHAVWGEVAGPDLLIVDGEEVTTRTGHWLALGIPAGHWIDWRYRGSDPDGADEFGRFAAQVRATGGIAVAAHPHAPCLGCSWGFGYDEVDAIEVWNGPWTADDEVSLADWDALLRRDGWRGGRWTPAIGNSDAHSEPQVVGLPQTVVHAGDLSAGGLVEGLRAGRSWLAESSAVQLSMRAGVGPHDWRRRAGIGELLPDGPDEPQLELTVSSAGPGPLVARLITETGVVAQVALPESGPGNVRQRLGEARWVRAEIRRPAPTTTAADTMVALTNPIFLRAR